MHMGRVYWLFVQRMTQALLVSLAAKHIHNGGAVLLLLPFTL